MMKTPHRATQSFRIRGEDREGRPASMPRRCSSPAPTR